MDQIIETERFRLRKFSLDDIAFVISLLNSPAWLEYIGDRNVRTEEEAIAYLENGTLKSYRDNGYGMMVVEKKETGEVIGSCGLVKRDFLEHPDIGFAFLPGHIGGGFGYEVAAAVMKHAQDELRIRNICAITLPNNFRSVRLLEKLGMKFEKTIVYPGTDEELSLYRS